jgi:hypothetical protein
MVHKNSYVHSCGRQAYGKCMEKRERRNSSPARRLLCRQHQRTAVVVLLTDNHQTWCLDQLAAGIFSKLHNHTS